MRWDPEAASSALWRYLKFVRIEHTLFALPMAYAAALEASGGSLTLWQAVWIAAAFVGLRIAGMSYNNIADREIDALNPRTKGRMLVTGAVSLRGAYATFAVGVALFELSAAMLGPWPLYLSLPYLAVTVTYPYAKRLHCLPHLHLGAVYALVPLGASIAVYSNDIRVAVLHTPWLLVLGSALWVAGFDTFYSKMDLDFDRRMGLGSIPACYGERAARASWVFLLVASAALYLWNYLSLGGGLPGLALTALGSAVEVWSAITALDEKRIPEAFNANLSVGLLIAAGVLANYLL
ncbi:UbiA-like polyprenyltransferase [Thermoproteus uzoniensis]|uniref:UbiA-like polyprenyltransferase n=1 Tax=Thermoproteus uzoniensis TaxID=184117 RepID=UPI00069BF507|nr:UbiA-like polyprenyltransferase [Thermoproteus uzoniensis]